MGTYTSFPITNKKISELTEVTTLTSTDLFSVVVIGTGTRKITLQNLQGQVLPATTLGDMVVHNGSSNVRLPVGTDNFVLTADSGAAEGVSWQAAGAASFPTTTKGDLVVHNGTTEVRLAVGSDGRFLTADSQATEGVSYGPTPSTAAANKTALQAIIDANQGTPANGERGLVWLPHGVWELDEPLVVKSRMFVWGPGVLKMSDTFGRSGTTGSITGMSGNSPCTITSTSHGRAVGDKIVITGTVGTTGLINNRVHRITAAPTANTFEINENSAGYSSGGTWELLNPNETMLLRLEAEGTQCENTFVDGIQFVGPDGIDPNDVYCAMQMDTLDNAHQLISCGVTNCRFEKINGLLGEFYEDYTATRAMARAFSLEFRHNEMEKHNGTILAGALHYSAVTNNRVSGAGPTGSRRPVYDIYHGASAGLNNFLNFGIVEGGDSTRDTKPVYVRMTEIDASVFFDFHIEQSTPYYTSETGWPTWSGGAAHIKAKFIRCRDLFFPRLQAPGGTDPALLQFEDCKHLRFDRVRLGTNDGQMQFRFTNSWAGLTSGETMATIEWYQQGNTPKRLGRKSSIAGTDTELTNLGVGTYVANAWDLKEFNFGGAAGVAANWRAFQTSNRFRLQPITTDASWEIYDQAGSQMFTVGSGVARLDHASNPRYRVIDTTNNCEAELQALNTSVQVGSVSNHQAELISNNTAAVILGTSQNAQFQKSATFIQQALSGTGAQSVNWTQGNKVQFTFGAGNVTFTFTAPSSSTNLLLKLIQDGTGGRTATWPATVKWPGGTAPTLSTGAGAVDVISFYFDGTNYYGASSLNFS